jgi:hypothetical protein
LRKVPEDELSFDHAMRDVRWKFFWFYNVEIWSTVSQLLQVKYTFGIDAQEYPYHTQVTRNHLSRNLQALFPVVYEEIHHAFSVITPLDQDGKFRHLLREDILTFFCAGWTKVRIYPEIMKAMCRVSNRLFVGLPLCEWFA